MIGNKLPFLNKKEQPKPVQKKELPSLAKGILHKDQLPQRTDIPQSLPSITRRPAREEPSLLLAPEESKSPFFSDHREEKISHEPPPPPRQRQQSIDEKEASFFSELATHLSAEEELMRRKLADPQTLMNRNLVHEMKEYWSAQKAQMNVLRQSKELEQDVLMRVEELRKLESEWQQLEQQIEQARIEMMQKERQIEEESKKLKALMQRWGIKRDAPKENWFVLASGQTCRNVPELAHHIRKMDSEQFSRHVTLGRNDFANWVRDVFGDTSLADRLDQEHDKSAIADVLEKAIQ